MKSNFALQVKNLFQLQSRFSSLLITYFLGSFNNYFYKSALLIFLMYQLGSTWKIGSLIHLVAGIYILPFILISFSFGQLIDVTSKTRVIRWCKAFDIALVLLIGIGFYFKSILLMLIAFLLFSVESSISNMAQYAILPDLLSKQRMMFASAWMLIVQFSTILAGSILGSWIAEENVGSYFLISTLFIMTILAWLASLYLPTIPSPSMILGNTSSLWRHPWRQAKSVTKEILKNENLSLAIVGITWFWAISAIYTSQLPTFTKTVLGLTTPQGIFLLTVAIVGVSIGLICSLFFLKTKILYTYVPVASICMSIFAIHLVYASTVLAEFSSQAFYISDLFSYASFWMVIADVFLLTFSSGIYLCPLYAILLIESETHKRAQTFAVVNSMSALLMVISALITSLLVHFNISLMVLFSILAAVNVLIALYICNLLPTALIKSFLMSLFKILYRVEVVGIENYHNAGERVVIVANHSSYLDAPLLIAFLPDKLTFAINSYVAQQWWLKLILKLFSTYSIDPANALAAKSLIEYVRSDQRVVIFPEGRITVTGALMKIYEGPGLIADKANASLLPIRIEGAQYTPFSYLRGKVKIRWFPKIKITILPPERFNLPVDMPSRERRRLISHQLYDLMTDSIYESSNKLETLFQSLIYTKNLYGRNRIVLEDIDRKPMSIKRLILASMVLGRKIRKTTYSGEFVGVLLPNSIGCVVVFFALQFIHRVPAMLNFSAGLNSLKIACVVGQIKKIYTSKRFVELANLQEIIAELQAQQIQIIYLEEVRNQIGIFSKLLGTLLSCLPNWYYHWLNGINKKNIALIAKQPAELLFTSGSEGKPKGVLLSHENIQANRYQLIARVDFSPLERVFNVLPMFHSFGLNAATLTPLICGMRVFVYPSPLHYRIIPELCYDTNASMIFGTDTFLSNYALYAHPYNFYSVRYVFAGAEKVKEPTKKIWAEKFGIRILEGYGVTEASPVVSVNTNMHYKPGAVGRLLPGMKYRLEEVPGIKQGQRLYVAGANIMMGYLLYDTPHKIIPAANGWHDTGDIVSVDEDGYITIIGRAKRFAKIGGEMVSLAAIEEQIIQIWPEAQHAIVIKEDENKIEQIVLLTTDQSLDRSRIHTEFKKLGMSELGLPKIILLVDEIPILGSGKTDYMKIVEQFL